MNYSRVPLGQMRGVPTNIDVLVCHPYIYGVLQELITDYGLRDRTSRRRRSPGTDW